MLPGRKMKVIYTVEWECKLVWLLLESVQRFFKKQKGELPYDSAVRVPDIYLKKCKLAYNRGTCASEFLAELFTIAK
jgi:hypothetical protein